MARRDPPPRYDLAKGNYELAPKPAPPQKILAKRDFAFDFIAAEFYLQGS